MLAIRPDYVLVQFGLVDDDVPSSDPMAVSFQEYADNLQTIVQIIRGFNGTPILITPPVERKFDDTGKVALVSTFEQRCAIMKDVAAELQTPLIDLNQMSIDLFNGLGDSGSAYIQAPGNPGHYSLPGAQVIAHLIVNALPDSLGTCLTGIFDPPPKP
jgi:lysophospholipase L1-like esterase